MSFLSKLLGGVRSLVLGEPSISPDESRDSPRILCQYRVNLRHKGVDHKASIVDIGTTGMRLDGVPRLEKGDSIFVSFPFADHFDEDSSFEVDIMWCRKNDLTDDLSAGARYKESGKGIEGTWVHTLLSEIGLTGTAVFQKRKHVRLTSTQKFFLRDEGTGQHILEGRVNNLSVGGALLESAFSLKKGRKVLALIGASVHSPTLSIRAQIMNSRVDVDDGSHLISIQFVELSKSQLKSLESLVIAMLEGRS